MAYRIISSDISTTTADAITVESNDVLVIRDGVAVSSETGTGIDEGASPSNVAIVIDGLVAAGDAVDLYGVTGNNAVEVSSTGKVIGTVGLGGTTATIVNDGEISGYNSGNNSLVFLSGDDSVLRNSGTITADGSYSEAVYFSGGTGDTGTFYNSGIVSHLESAGSPNPAYSVNSSAFVQLTVYNSGLLDGDVDFGSQGDLYQASGAGTVNGAVYGNSGNDTLRGAAGEDTLVGGADNDSLYGGDGDDLLTGSTGNDFVVGGDGDDMVYGEIGNDTLAGRSGDDMLYGGDGADTILGGRGEDMIYSGLGADVLKGGGDRDTFVFDSVAEIDGPSSRDRILDFKRGEDVLDFSGIDADTTKAGDQAFVWIGKNAYSGTQPELRYSPGNGFIQGDVDGDGVNDFKLVLLNNVIPLESDLIL